MPLTEATGIGRMAVESRVAQLGGPRPGELLRVRSRIAAVGAKAVTTQHRLESDAGAILARAEHGIVAVDLKARRAVELPEFPRTAAREGA